MGKRGGSAGIGGEVATACSAPSEEERGFRSAGYWRPSEVVRVEHWKPLPMLGLSVFLIWETNGCDTAHISAIAWSLSLPHSRRAIATEHRLSALVRRRPWKALADRANLRASSRLPGMSVAAISDNPTLRAAMTRCQPSPIQHFASVPNSSTGGNSAPSRMASAYSLTVAMSISARHWIEASSSIVARARFTPPSPW